MSLTIDPQKYEVRALQRVTNWLNQTVIELGCGAGRLSMRLAELGAHVTAIDPDAALIREARSSLPQQHAPHINYRVGQAEHLTQAKNKFDLAVFSWVL